MANGGYTGSINVSTGLDSAGHIGYAAQPGLAPLGTDVFTESPLDTATVTGTVTKTTPAVTSTVNKTVTQTVTQSLPGAIFTVTTPGGTRKVKVVAAQVPKLTGLTKAQAEGVLSSVGLKLGSVKTPKAKKGYTAVVSAASPGAGKASRQGLQGRSDHEAGEGLAKDSRMTTDAHSPASSHRGGRAFTPGPRKVYLGAALIAIAIAVIVVLAIKPGGGSSTGQGPLNVALSKKYGHPVHATDLALPAKQTIARATAAKPSLNTMEGDTVRAVLPHGSAEVFGEGPIVPGWVANEASAGKLPAGTTVPGTYEFRFSAVHGSIPLSARDFTLITYQGTLIHPTVRPLTGGPLPAEVPAGGTYTVKLTTKVPEGDGELRWGPGGRKILVSYFWTLEFD